VLSDIVSVKVRRDGQRSKRSSCLYVLNGMLKAAETLLRHQLQNIRKNGINDKVLAMIVRIRSHKFAYFTWFPHMIIRAYMIGLAEN
jgi:hypothetical protein